MAPTLAHFVNDLWADAHTPSILWQAGTLALCLLLAWWSSRLLRASVDGRFEQAAATRRVPVSPFAERSIAFGRGSFERLAFPLLALGLVLLGRLILASFEHVNLLHLAVPLLSAMAAIRVVVYLLRKVFSVSAALKAGERWIALIIWLAVAVHAVGLAPDIIALLESVGFRIGKQNFNLWLIGQAIFSISATLLVALWLAAVLEGRLMSTDGLDMSFRVVVGRFVKALVVVVAVMVSMALVGIDLTVLSVFGGALGVGLGLGLQRIASNYLSGFIILLDHSIRIGDLVTVDKFSGAVTQIATRYTVLKGLDGTESILPNEMLVNTPVLNHSYTNRKVALSIALAVAYDSDLDAVQEIMLAAAKGHERVLAEPPPKVSLARFGADGLELEMGFWIEDPERGSANVRSDLNFAIWRQFKAKGIEIPFPQREIRMVGAAQPVGENGRIAPAAGPAGGGSATASK